jgi:hypothetical protein
MDSVLLDTDVLSYLFKQVHVSGLTTISET